MTKTSSVDKLFALWDSWLTAPGVFFSDVEVAASMVIFSAGEHMKDDIPAAYNLLVGWDIFS
jgi:hypothetical protein